MGLASEMKNLSEDILASFKNRIKENEDLVIEVQKTLDGFRKDHQEMTAVLNANAVALRKGLSLDEKERLKEADVLMKKMIKEHKEMAVALRTGLDKDEKIRMNEFIALMKSINDKISEIFAYTDDMLEKSEVERLKEFVILMKSINEEISEIFTYTHDLLAKSEAVRLQEFIALMKSINEEVLRIFTYTHDMIAKGEEDRLKEFDRVMTGIQNDVKNLKKAVADLLGDFAQDREGASASWKKMSDILAQLRKTAVTPPKEIVKKVEKKEEAKKVIPAEKVKETPVKTEPEPLVNMSLEEKVLDYINKHPKGVKVSEMEKPLAETRMKLGYIAKGLLDEGKILKIENVYFPKPVK